jgi:hypothetical protein
VVSYADATRASAMKRYFQPSANLAGGSFSRIITETNLNQDKISHENSNDDKSIKNGTSIKRAVDCTPWHGGRGESSPKDKKIIRACVAFIIAMPFVALAFALLFDHWKIIL